MTWRQSSSLNITLSRIKDTHGYIDRGGDRSEGTTMSARARQIVVGEHAEDRRVPETIALARLDHTKLHVVIFLQVTVSVLMMMMMMKSPYLMHRKVAQGNV